MPWLQFCCRDPRRRRKRACDSTRQPIRDGKLTEGGAEYNRHRPARVQPQPPKWGTDCGCLDGLPSICKAASQLRTERRFLTTVEGHTMTTFDKREEAFELQFAHDEELRFK